jgi:hypothetical protein
MPPESRAELRVIDGQTDDYCEGLETIRPQSQRDVEAVCVCNELCLNSCMPKILQRPGFYQLFEERQARCIEWLKIAVKRIILRTEMRFQLDLS